uniref:C2H2-type domain-containing protein n=1 Tax=Clastoptera arizonana TaxID=38151 RepID=A0A1B6E359_9HEMI
MLNNYEDASSGFTTSPASVPRSSETQKQQNIGPTWSYNSPLDSIYTCYQNDHQPVYNIHSMGHYEGNAKHNTNTYPQYSTSIHQPVPAPILKCQEACCQHLSERYPINPAPLRYPASGSVQPPRYGEITSNDPRQYFSERRSMQNVPRKKLFNPETGYSNGPHDRHIQYIRRGGQIHVRESRPSMQMIRPQYPMYPMNSYWSSRNWSGPRMSYPPPPPYHQSITSQANQLQSNFKMTEPPVYIDPNVAKTLNPQQRRALLRNANGNQEIVRPIIDPKRTQGNGSHIQGCYDFPYHPGFVPFNEVNKMPSNSISSQVNTGSCKVPIDKQYTPSQFSNDRSISGCSNTIGDIPYPYPHGDPYIRNTINGMQQMTDTRKLSLQFDQQSLSKKRPELDVRQFLATWDDDEEDCSRLAETIHGGNNLAPYIVVDCRSLEGEAAEKLQERIKDQNCQQKIQNECSSSLNDIQSKSADDNNTQRAMAHPEYSVQNNYEETDKNLFWNTDASKTCSENENLLGKSSFQPLDCSKRDNMNVVEPIMTSKRDSHLHSDINHKLMTNDPTNHMSFDALVTYYGDSRRINEGAYDLVEMTERLVSASDKICSIERNPHEQDISDDGLHQYPRGLQNKMGSTNQSTFHHRLPPRYPSSSYQPYKSGINNESIFNFKYPVGSNKFFGYDSSNLDPINFDYHKTLPEFTHQKSYIQKDKLLDNFQNEELNKSADKIDDNSIGRCGLIGSEKSSLDFIGVDPEQFITPIIIKKSDYYNKDNFGELKSMKLCNEMIGMTDKNINGEGSEKPLEVGPNDSESDIFQIAHSSGIIKEAFCENNVVTLHSVDQSENNTVTVEVPYNEQYSSLVKLSEEMSGSVDINQTKLQENHDQEPKSNSFKSKEKSVKKPTSFKLKRLPNSKEWVKIGGDVDLETTESKNETSSLEKPIESNISNTALNMPSLDDIRFTDELQESKEHSHSPQQNTAKNNDESSTSINNTSKNVSYKNDNLQSTQLAIVSPMKFPESNDLHLKDSVVIDTSDNKLSSEENFLSSDSHTVLNAYSNIALNDHTKSPFVDSNNPPNLENTNSAENTVIDSLISEQNLEHNYSDNKKESANDDFSSTNECLDLNSGDILCEENNKESFSPFNSYSDCDMNSHMNSYFNNNRLCNDDKDMDSCILSSPGVEDMFKDLDKPEELHLLERQGSPNPDAEIFNNDFDLVGVEQNCGSDQTINTNNDLDLKPTQNDDVACKLLLSEDDSKIGENEPIVKTLPTIPPINLKLNERKKRWCIAKKPKNIDSKSESKMCCNFYNKKSKNNLNVQNQEQQKDYLQLSPRYSKLRVSEKCEEQGEKMVSNTSEDFDQNKTCNLNIVTVSAVKENNLPIISTEDPSICNISFEKDSFISSKSNNDCGFSKFSEIESKDYESLDQSLFDSSIENSTNYIEPDALACKIAHESRSEVNENDLVDKTNCDITNIASSDPFHTYLPKEITCSASEDKISDKKGYVENIQTENQLFSKISPFKELSSDALTSKNQNDFELQEKIESDETNKRISVRSKQQPALELMNDENNDEINSKNSEIEIITDGDNMSIEIFKTLDNERKTLNCLTDRPKFYIPEEEEENLNFKCNSPIHDDMQGTKDHITTKLCNTINNEYSSCQKSNLEEEMYIETNQNVDFNSDKITTVPTQEWNKTVDDCNIELNFSLESESKFEEMIIGQGKNEKIGVPLNLSKEEILESENNGILNITCENTTVTSVGGELSNFVHEEPLVTGETASVLYEKSLVNDESAIFLNEENCLSPLNLYKNHIDKISESGSEEFLVKDPLEEINGETIQDRDDHQEICNNESFPVNQNTSYDGLKNQSNHQVDILTECTTKFEITESHSSCYEAKNNLNSTNVKIISQKTMNIKNHQNKHLVDNIISDEKDLKYVEISGESTIYNNLVKNNDEKNITSLTINTSTSSLTKELIQETQESNDNADLKQEIKTKRKENRKNKNTRKYNGIRRSQLLCNIKSDNSPDGLKISKIKDVCYKEIEKTHFLEMNASELKNSFTENDNNHNVCKEDLKVKNKMLVFKNEGKSLDNVSNDSDSELNNSISVSCTLFYKKEAMVRTDLSKPAHSNETFESVNTCKVDDHFPDDEIITALDENSVIKSNKEDSCKLLEEKSNICCMEMSSDLKLTSLEENCYKKIGNTYKISSPKEVNDKTFDESNIGNKDLFFNKLDCSEISEEGDTYKSENDEKQFNCKEEVNSFCNTNSNGLHDEAFHPCNKEREEVGADYSNSFHNNIKSITINTFEKETIQKVNHELKNSMIEIKNFDKHSEDIDSYELDRTQAVLNLEDDMNKLDSTQHNINIQNINTEGEEIKQESIIAIEANSKSIYKSDILTHEREKVEIKSMDSEISVAKNKEFAKGSMHEIDTTSNNDSLFDNVTQSNSIENDMEKTTNSNDSVFNTTVVESGDIEIETSNINDVVSQTLIAEIKDFHTEKSNNNGDRSLTPVAEINGFHIETPNINDVGSWSPLTEQKHNGTNFVHNLNPIISFNNKLVNQIDESKESEKLIMDTLDATTKLNNLFDQESQAYTIENEKFQGICSHNSSVASDPTVSRSQNLITQKKELKNDCLNSQVIIPDLNVPCVEESQTFDGSEEFKNDCLHYKDSTLDLIVSCDEVSETSIVESRELNKEGPHYKDAFDLSISCAEVSTVENEELNKKCFNYKDTIMDLNISCDEGSQNSTVENEEFKKQDCLDLKSTADIIVSPDEGSPTSIIERDIQKDNLHFKETDFIVSCDEGSIDESEEIQKDILNYQNIKTELNIFLDDGSQTSFPECEQSNKNHSNCKNKTLNIDFSFNQVFQNSVIESEEIKKDLSSNIEAPTNPNSPFDVRSNIVNAVQKLDKKINHKLKRASIIKNKRVSTKLISKSDSLHEDNPVLEIGSQRKKADLFPQVNQSIEKYTSGKEILSDPIVNSLQINISKTEEYHNINICNDDELNVIDLIENASNEAKENVEGLPVTYTEEEKTDLNINLVSNYSKPNIEEMDPNTLEIESLLDHMKNKITNTEQVIKPINVIENEVDKAKNNSQEKSNNFLNNLILRESKHFNICEKRSTRKAYLETKRKKLVKGCFGKSKKYLNTFLKSTYARLNEKKVNLKNLNDNKCKNVVVNENSDTIFNGLNKSLPAKDKGNIININKKHNFTSMSTDILDKNNIEVNSLTVDNTSEENRNSEDVHHKHVLLATKPDCDELVHLPGLLFDKETKLIQDIDCKDLSETIITLNSKTKDECSFFQEISVSDVDGPVFQDVNLTDVILVETVEKQMEAMHSTQLSEEIKAPDTVSGNDGLEKLNNVNFDSEFQIYSQKNSKKNVVAQTSQDQHNLERIYRTDSTTSDNESFGTEIINGNVNSETESISSSLKMPDKDTTPFQCLVEAAFAVETADAKKMVFTFSSEKDIDNNSNKVIEKKKDESFIYCDENISENLSNDNKDYVNYTKSLENNSNQKVDVIVKKYKTKFRFPKPKYKLKTKKSKKNVSLNPAKTNSNEENQIYDVDKEFLNTTRNEDVNEEVDCLENIIIDEKSDEVEEFVNDKPQTPNSSYEDLGSDFENQNLFNYIYKPENDLFQKTSLNDEQPIDLNYEVVDQNQILENICMEDNESLHLQSSALEAEENVVIVIGELETGVTSGEEFDRQITKKDETSNCLEIIDKNVISNDLEEIPLINNILEESVNNGADLNTVVPLEALDIGQVFEVPDELSINLSNDIANWPYVEEEVTHLDISLNTEKSTEKSNVHLSSVKCSLPWERIFNIAKSKNRDLRKNKRFYSNGLELGPAKIELRLASDSSSWKVVNNKSDNNFSPIVNVGRLILQRDPELSSFSEKDSEEEIDCNKKKSTDDMSNEEYGNQFEYHDWLRLANDKKWQPLVILNRDKTLDNLSIQPHESVNVRNISSPINDSFVTSNSREKRSSSLKESEKTEPINEDIESNSVQDFENELFTSTISKEDDFHFSDCIDPAQEYVWRCLDNEEDWMERSSLQSYCNSRSEKYSYDGSDMNLTSSSSRINIDDSFTLSHDSRDTSENYGETDYRGVKLKDWKHYEYSESTVQRNIGTKKKHCKQELPFIFSKNRNRGVKRPSEGHLREDTKRRRLNRVEKYPFHCRKCCIGFKTKEEMCHHKDTHHPPHKELHHCLLCQRSFSSSLRHSLHVKGRSHRHLELVQRHTVHAVHQLLTGDNFPFLRPISHSEQVTLNWKPGQPGCKHYYYQPTPLQLALQEYSMRHVSSDVERNVET